MERMRRFKVLVLTTVCSVTAVLIYTSTLPTTNRISYINHIWWMRQENCQVRCRTGIPCEYPDEVDFRVIVMTYTRSKSLNHTLNSLLNLDTLNDRVSVEIWIDRSKSGKIDGQTVKIAQNFVNKFSVLTSKGRACIHKQNKNAHIGGQWVFTWRPKHEGRELGLILEDDIIVSPLAYKWIKLLHNKYGHESSVAGYTLQMENVNFFSEIQNKGAMKGPPDQQVFLYPVLGTWGYAPHPKAWREFQDWYVDMRPDRNVKTDKIQPFVPGIVPTGWYKGFLKSGSQESMWEIWHIKFADQRKLFTMYSNLLLYTKRRDVLLSNNRREKGLHFGKGMVVDNAKMLLKAWNKSFEKLPPYEDLAHYNYNGSPCTENCCFDTGCLTQ